MNMKAKFEEFVESICTENNLNPAILNGYLLIFEGISDMKRAFDTNDVINDIINKFSGGRRSFGTQLETHKIGFQYRKTNYMYGIDLNIRWLTYEPDSNQHSLYDPESNFIFIQMTPDDYYDGYRDSILDIINTHRKTLAHELQHWIDENLLKLTPTKYTRMSQIENPKLIDIIAKIQKSTEGLVGDEYDSKIDELNNGTLTDTQYNNAQIELNANIAETIYGMIEDYMNLDNDGKITRFQIPFKQLLDNFNVNVPFKLLTNDSKKRLIKRLYVFHNALYNISTLAVSSTEELKEELLKYFKSTSNEKLESIEYTHYDIMHNRDKVFFEANYKFDPEYREWFNNKYCKQGHCIVSTLAESVKRFI